MSTEIKCLPAVWSKELGIEVLDPDGWRADGMPWGLAITEQDFRRRAAMSTMREVATPAPLDPSKVMAGDTVTLTKDETTVRGPVVGISYSGGGEWDIRVGDLQYRRVGRIGLWAVTDHQPAPEPEPEVKPEPGMSGTATVEGQPGTCGVWLRSLGGTLWFATYEAATSSGNLAALDEVTDFVPDEPRPLPTREQVAEAIQGDVASPADEFGDVYAIHPGSAADRVMVLLTDGAS